MRSPYIQVLASLIRSERPCAHHMRQLFDLSSLDPVFINLLHIFVDLEYLEETMPMCIVRSIHC